MEGTASGGGEGTVIPQLRSWYLHFLKDTGNGFLTSPLEIYQGDLKFDSDCLRDHV